MSLQSDIESAINRASAENPSGTPDFILAEFLTDCLAAFDKATIHRGDWRGEPAVFMPGDAPVADVTEKGTDL